MFGALGGVLPLRLGGTAANGWTAAQQSRVVADGVAVARVQPFAAFRYTKSGATVTILDYVGANGNGLAYAPTPTVNGTGDVTFTWSGGVYEDATGNIRAIALRTLLATCVAPSSIRAMGTIVAANAVRVVTAFAFNSDASVSISVWGGTEAERLTIGDYGGEPDKLDSETEGRVPYAANILAELQAMRGTAYTQTVGRLVDVENLALARFLAATGPRTAEKLRANAVPGTSDERLGYWQRFLAVPQKPGEPRWRLRQKLAAHYKAGDGPTIEAINAALTELLGDVFVSATWDEGASLSAPPTPTFWPDVNPGPAQASLGGGAWLSTRNHLFVLVQIPSGVSLGQFLTLVNVDMQSLLDRILPAWATFDWATSAGFYVATDDATGDGSLIDFDGV